MKKIMILLPILLLPGCMFLPPDPLPPSATQAEIIQYNRDVAEYEETMQTVNTISKFDPTGTIGIGAGILGVVGTVSAALGKAKAKARQGEYSNAMTALVDGIEEAKNELPDEAKEKLLSVLKDKQVKHGAVSVIAQHRVDLKKPDKRV